MRHVLQYIKRKIYGTMILTSTIIQHIKTKMNACKKLDMLPFAQSKMQFCSRLMLYANQILMQIFSKFINYNGVSLILYLLLYCELDRFLKCEVVRFLNYLFKT